MFNTKTIRQLRKEKSDKKWHRSYTYRTFSFVARRFYFALQTLGYYAKITVGLLGFLAIAPLFQKRKEISLMLAFAFGLVLPAAIGA